MTMTETMLFSAGAALSARYLLVTIVPFLKRRMEATAHKRAMELKEDFLLLPSGKIFLILFLSGTMSAAFVMCLTANIYWTILSFLSPIVLSGIAVRYIRRRRWRKVVSQLPGFLDILAGHVKAGHSFQEALSDAIPLLPTEISNEIIWIYQLCKLGTPLTEALLLWEERIPCEEITLVVRPLRIALPVGGNVVDLLMQTRDILRMRNRMEEKMRAMTAQARLQAIVLTLLPPAFVVVLSKVDSGYFRQCTGTFEGKTILAVAGVLQLFGWLMIRKMLSVKP